MAKNKTGPGVWVTQDNGYEKTDSQKIIQLALSTVMKKRRSVMLLFKKYQSRITVFVSIDSDSLTIDKPMDWPGLKHIRVVFKDEAKVWNHFTVRVIREGKDTVKTKFPTELFRMQRRAHFRIELPSVSRLSFIHRGTPVTDVALSNISTGGLMMCYAQGEQPGEIKDQDAITNLEIELYPPAEGVGDNPEESAVLHISKATCVRSFEDKDNKKKCLGVQFKPRPNEEMKLMQQIRQLELEELRKGIGML